MSRTTNLRRQHDAALALVDEIKARAALPPDHNATYALSLLLSRLTGILRIHFAQEDKTLYPHMISSSSEDAARTAAAFKAEMGDLGAVYRDFADRWATSNAISRDPDGFRRESAAIFAALVTRITRENEELYPLADAIEFTSFKASA